jgi:hypothetical protein
MTKLSLDEEIAIRKFTGRVVGPVLRARQAWRWLRQAWHVVLIPVVMASVVLGITTTLVVAWIFVDPAVAILLLFAVFVAAGMVLENLQ